MPTIPAYKPGQVGPVQTTEERFRPVDNGGGALGGLAKGMGHLGGAMADFAVQQDAMQAQFDETYARQVDIETRAEFDPVVSAYGQLQGKNAVDQGAATQGQLAAIRDKALAKATNPRMRAMLEARLGERYASYLGAVGEHSAKQLRAMEEGTYRSEMALAGDDMAKLYEAPEKMEAARATGLAALDRLGARLGWSPEMAEAERKKWLSDAHGAVVDQMTAQTLPDYAMASAYLDAHGDEMTADALTDARRALKAPLEELQIDSHLASVAASMPNAVTAGAALSNTGYDPAAVKSLIRGPESGGNDRATNGMGSSASGRYQFVEGTFKSVYTKVYGGSAADAAAAWRDKRFDAGVQERLMDQLMADNSKALRGAGLPVNNGNMYVMHVLGSGNGPKLLRADQGAPVASLLSAEVVRQNPTYFGGGKTVAQALGVIRGKVGGGRVDDAPRAWDKDALYNAIDARADAEGWNPTLRAAVKKAGDRMVSSDEELLGRQYRLADDEAARHMAQLGDKFTSTAQLPSALRRAMNPTTLATLEDNLRKAREKPPEANGGTVMTLNQMRYSEPEKFKTLSLADYAGKVTPGEMDTLLSQQAQMRSARPGDFNPAGNITSAVSFGKRVGGINFSAPQETAIFQTMEDEARALHAQGKPVDYNALFRSAAGTIRAQNYVLGFAAGKSEIKRYDIGIGFIPDDRREAIAAQFKAQYKREPTNAEILRVYRSATR